MIDRTRPAAVPGVMQIPSELELLRQKLIAAEQAKTELGDQLQSRSLELERTQARLQSLTSYAPHFIHIVDTDLRVTFINRGGSKVGTDAIIGTKVGEYMLPADRRRVRRRLRRVLATGKPTQYEFAGMGEGREPAWYRTMAGPIKSQGKITGLTLTTFDITEDHDRTQSLLEDKRVAEAARARDSVLLNSIGEGLLVIDEYGLIANTNPSASAMLGFSVAEMTGQWFPRMIQALDDAGREIDAFDRPAIRALLTGSIISERIHYRRKDGTNFPAAVTISPVVIGGKPVGAIEVFRDLTRERELDQAKEEFVSLASHQLRTPATGVKAYISMLLDGYAGELQPRQEEFLRKVYDTNERQLQIVGDMLNVARADSGRVVPELATIDLRALLQEVIDEQRATITDRRQRLVTQLPSKAVHAVIDAKLMRMALENVLSNASKYTPEEGSITFGLRVTPRHVTIAVRDTGVGIAEADLPKLFKRFSRIDNPLSTRRGGTGLGLYLTQTIVMMHQGRTNVESRKGVGTTFTIELPLVPAASGSAAPRPAAGKSDA